MSDHFEFRSWMAQQSGEFDYIVEDEDHIRLKTDYAVAEINFYRMDPEPEIVEFRIDTIPGGDTKFFLHFHAENEEHATGLFAEMVQTLYDLRQQTKKEILLCCTSGLTTSFFAEKLNEEAEKMELPYSFSAVSVSDIFEAGVDKAAILLAPQIRYMQADLAKVMPASVILSIPTKIFGMYDANSCVKLVDEEIKKLQKTLEETVIEKIHPGKENTERILVVSSHFVNQKAHLYYRVYDHNQIELDEIVIKNKMTIRDICDIIDTQVCSCSNTIDVDKIGIAIPGIVNDGYLDLPPTNNTDLMNGEKGTFNIVKYFEDRYHVPVTVSNNTNCAAIGWYGQQNEYKNVVFYSQPRGWTYGGQGFVVDGKLMSGRMNSAGELKYIMNHFNYRNPLRFSPFNPDDIKEIVKNVLLMDIVMIDPEVICVRSELTPDMEELRQILLQYIPESHIPKLVYIDNYNEYIMLGQLLLCLKGE